MSLTGTALPAPPTESRPVDAVGILVIEADSTTPLGPRIVFANEATSRLTGYELTSLIGSPLGLIYDRGDLGNLVAKLPAVAERATYCWMNRPLVRNGGERSPFRWTIRPTQRDEHPPRHFTLTISEVERDEPDPPSAPQAAIPALDPPEESDPTEADDSGGLEERIDESRQESLAMAAGGVAHDFKNALQAIKSNLEMAAGSAPPEGTTLRAYLEDAHVALNDAETLARQMLAFTRGESPKRCHFQLTELLRRVSRLCTAGSRIRCQLMIEPALDAIEGDPNRIYQVFHNLVINACQAMPGGGVLHLTAANVDFAADNRFSVPPGRYVTVSVRDRGCGIPADVLPHIFDRHFTTKKDGSGFGLAWCLAIVEQHGGTIRAASREGVGTEFLVFLPALGDAPDSAPPPAIADEHPAMARRSAETATPSPEAGRVLLVEDQPAVAKAAQGLLSHLGCIPVPAQDGDEAVRIYRQHLDSSEPIDVVLLDMTLPGGLNGKDVLERLQRLDRHVRVIATSGYFEGDPEESLKQLGFCGVLAKPYSMDALSEVLGEALSS